MNALRKMKRQVAKSRMQKAGIRHMCKHEAQGHKTNNSYFSKHWRESIRKDGKQ